MPERWRQVKGYEGYYEVSSLGQVRSVARSVAHYFGESQREGMLIAPATDANGYSVVSLWKDNKSEMRYVHQLVGIAFVPPFQGESINHKDFQRGNNKPENLEWVTLQENNQHMVSAGRGPSRAVLHVDSGKQYQSATEAARALGGNDPSAILRVCNGELEHYKGNHYQFIKEAIHG